MARSNLDDYLLGSYRDPREEEAAIGALAGLGRAPAGPTDDQRTGAFTALARAGQASAPQPAAADPAADDAMRHGAFTALMKSAPQPQEPDPDAAPADEAVKLMEQGATGALAKAAPVPEPEPDPAPALEAEQAKLQNAIGGLVRAAPPPVVEAKAEPGPDPAIKAKADAIAHAALSDAGLWRKGQEPKPLKPVPVPVGMRDKITVVEEKPKARVVDYSSDPEVLAQQSFRLERDRLGNRPDRLADVPGDSELIDPERKMSPEEFEAVARGRENPDMTFSKAETDANGVKALGMEVPDAKPKVAEVEAKPAAAILAAKTEEKGAEATKPIAGRGELAAPVNGAQPDDSTSGGAKDAPVATPPVTSPQPSEAKSRGPTLLSTPSESSASDDGRPSLNPWAVAASLVLNRGRDLPQVYATAAAQENEWRKRQEANKSRGLDDAYKRAQIEHLASTGKAAGDWKADESARGWANIEHNQHVLDRLSGNDASKTATKTQAQQAMVSFLKSKGVDMTGLEDAPYDALVKVHPELSKEFAIANAARIGEGEATRSGLRSAASTQNRLDVEHDAAPRTAADAAAQAGGVEQTRLDVQAGNAPRAATNAANQAAAVVTAQNQAGITTPSAAESRARETERAHERDVFTEKTKFDVAAATQIDKIESVLKKYQNPGDVPGVGVGQGFIPDMARSTLEQIGAGGNAQDALTINNARSWLGNELQRKESGAAGPEAERYRYLMGAGASQNSTPEELAVGLNAAKELTKLSIVSRAAGREDIAHEVLDASGLGHWLGSPSRPVASSVTSDARVPKPEPKNVPGSGVDDSFVPRPVSKSAGGHSSAAPSQTGELGDRAGVKTADDTADSVHKVVNRKTGKKGTVRGNLQDFLDDPDNKDWEKAS